MRRYSLGHFVLRVRWLNTMADVNWPELITAACHGNQRAWGTVVEHVRPFLRQAAGRDLAGRVRRRVDPSDVVQRSLLEAWQARATFAGASQAELLAWLSRILERNLRDAVRVHIEADKRSVRQERSLEELRSSGAARPEVFISSELSPQSQVVRREAFARLVQFLDELPPRQRQAVRMRYLERRTLKEIAAHFECNENTAAQLIARGLANLRHRHRHQSPSN